MKSHSLNSSMRKILLCFVIILLLIGSSMLLFGNQVFLKIGKSMSIQQSVNTYFFELASIQEGLLTQLVDKTESDYVDYLKRLDLLLKQSEEIASVIQNPCFIDLRYITETYVQTAEKFLEAPSSEAVKYYVEISQLQQMVQNQYAFFTSVKEDFGSNQFMMIKDEWRLRMCGVTLLLLAGIYFVFMAGHRFIRRTVEPIVQLTEWARQIAGGHFFEKIPSDKITLINNEIKVLANAFEVMSDTIQEQMNMLQQKIATEQEMHRLEAENMQMQVSLKETEMLFQQSLINPHFLFNCLNTLSSLAYLEHAPRVRSASSKIAHFLRQALERVGKEVTIEEELKHVELYTQIQKLRFEERISFSIQIEPECLKIKMPAMIVQPLVENAISHGVNTYLGDGRIEISTKREGDSVAIYVTDNGIGMSKEKIHSILSKEKFSPSNEADEIGRNGIGLQNIIRRLAVLYGEQGYVQIDSVPNNTVVSVHFPITPDAN